MSKEINKANKGTGAGGAKTNETGLSFEEDVYLKGWIEDKGYQLNPIGETSSKRSVLYEILDNGEVIAYYGRQNKIYLALQKIEPLITNEYISEVFSRKINPDAFIISKKPKVLTIFEKKWQQSAGSVDEKIQTAPFKIAMFEKLLRNFNISVRYQYILSEWFRSAQYRNIKEYYEDNEKVNVWVDGENLSNLDVDQFIKP